MKQLHKICQFRKMGFKTRFIRGREFLVRCWGFFHYHSRTNGRQLGRRKVNEVN